MLTPLVRPFDPETCGQEALDEFAALVLASMAVDRPDVPPQRTPEAIIRRMRVPDPGEGERLRMAAYLDGRLAGFLRVVVPETGQDAGVEITVHPELRGRGVGTALLREALSLLAQRGRTIIEGWWILADGVGERWALKRGFRRTHATVAQTLTVADAATTTTVPAGYRTTAWVNHAPAELVESYADARRAIEDAPLGESAYESPAWTVERIRKVEAEQQELGIEQRVVVAVHEESKAVVGFTEVELNPVSKEQAHQFDTAVLPAHRGHGLGLHIKARMVEWLRVERPEVARIVTSTGADNTHMIEVNTALGYVTSHTMAVVTGEVQAIRLT